MMLFQLLIGHVNQCPETFLKTCFSELLMQQVLQKHNGPIRAALALVQRWLGRLRVGTSSKRRFVIFGIGRTGSVFLCRMLNLQDDIVCASELFNLDEPYFLNSGIKKFVNRTKEERDRNPREFLQRFWSFDTAGACLGFKMFFTHDAKIIDDLVADRSVRKIILSRRNKVKRYVSWSVAQITKCWTKFDSTPTQQVKVKIDPQSLLESARRNDRRYEDIRRRLVSSNQSFKEIYYEDLVGDEKIDCLNGVAEYIGCRSIDSSRWDTDAVYKQNSDKLEDIVENYEELKAALQGTELAQFLD